MNERELDRLDLEAHGIVAIPQCMGSYKLGFQRGIEYATDQLERMTEGGDFTVEEVIQFFRRLPTLKELKINEVQR